MAIKDLMGPGIGFNPGSVKFIITRGLDIAIPVPSTYTSYVSANNRLETVVKGVKTHQSNTDGSTDILGLLNTEAGRKKKSTRVTATYTALATDHIIYFNTDDGDADLFLPPGIPETEYEILLTGSSGNILTMKPNGDDKLFGFNEDFPAYDYEGFTMKFNSIEGWR